MERLRTKERKTEGLLKKADAKVISITQAIESKALLIIQMQQTLSISATVLPHLDIREGDCDSDGKRSKAPMSTSLPFNGEGFSASNLAILQEEKNEEEASTPDDFLDSTSEALMGEDKFDPMKSNSSAGIMQYDSGRLRKRKGARSENISNYLAGDSNMTNVEGANEEEAEEHPPLVDKSQDDSHEVQLASLKEGNNKLRNVSMTTKERTVR